MRTLFLFIVLMLQTSIVSAEGISAKVFFNAIDADRNDHITVTEISQINKSIGVNIPGYKLRNYIAQLDQDNNGTLELNEVENLYQTSEPGMLIEYLKPKIEKMLIGQ